MYVFLLIAVLMTICVELNYSLRPPGTNDCCSEFKCKEGKKASRLKQRPELTRIFDTVTIVIQHLGTNLELLFVQIGQYLKSHV